MGAKGCFSVFWDDELQPVLPTLKTLNLYAYVCRIIYFCMLNNLMFTAKVKTEGTVVAVSYFYTAQ